PEPTVEAHFPSQTAEPQAIATQFLPGDLDAVADELLRNAPLGGCIAVVCGTVSRAQHLYRQFTQAAAQLPDGPNVCADTVLLHSRFIASARQRTEQELVNRLGKDHSRRPQRLIVISTQVIEQGLDLDFDLMISDIAPLDLLIQRMGRVHRHPLPAAIRPSYARSPRFLITGAADGDVTKAPPRFPTGLRMVYRPRALLAATFVLSNHLRQPGCHGVARPHDVPRLVEQAYNANLQAPSPWAKEWEQACDLERQFLQLQSGRAKTYLLPPPTLEGINHWNDTQGIAVEGVAHSQVRDADESYEVILARETAEGTLTSMDPSAALDGVDLRGPLSEKQARALSACSLRLPGWLVQPEDMEAMSEETPPSWSSSPWLRHAVPLIVDANSTKRCVSGVLKYDPHIGLTAEPHRKEPP
ncbi:CRISPR-associated helicase Cas3', partial [Corynebacterium heidelbergense]